MNLFFIIINLTLIKYVYSCYTNLTHYKTLYNYVPTQTLVQIPSTNCYTNIVTSYRYPDSCDGGLRNQGYRCNTNEYITTIRSCNETISKYMSYTTTLIPTTIAETYIYKLNCQNKTYSTLLTII